jgi:hypothetical protein
MPVILLYLIDLYLLVTSTGACYLVCRNGSDQESEVAEYKALPYLGT